MAKDLLACMWQDRVKLRESGNATKEDYRRCCVNCKHFKDTSPVGTNGFCFDPDGPERAPLVRYDKVCDHFESPFPTLYDRARKCARMAADGAK